jgi:tyrosinase
MTTVVESNTLRKKAGQPLVRYDLRRYSDQDVRDLREAFQALYDISDEAPGDRRGYWAVARGHGYDEELCHNDPELFLTWHRGYVYWFEKALSAAFAGKRGDEDLVITLPYWDWTVLNPETDAENGLPRSLDEDTWRPPYAVEEQRNPLKSARSLYRVERVGLTGDQQFTRRYPSQYRRAIPQLAQMVAGYYRERVFGRFNQQFDTGAHGAIHVLVGGQGADSPLPRNQGDMAAVVSAAFDPIFWLHHCMVDRVFFRWQELNGNSTVSDHVRETTVYGGFTGDQVLASESFLKVVYGSAPAAASRDSVVVAQGTEEAPLPPTMTVRIDGLVDGIDYAYLHLQGMRPPLRSYEVRVFLNEEGADASTPIEGNPRHAGTLFFFGHGECTGADGHCAPELATRDAYDRRPDHPLKKRNYSLDITGAVRAVASDGGAGEEVLLSFVVLDCDGNQVAPEELDFESIDLVAD